MSNPNNCKTCEHGRPPRKPEDGHCYMFKDAPTEVCMQHTGRRIQQYNAAPLETWTFANPRNTK
jgi:hypothetical protein